MRGHGIMRLLFFIALLISIALPSFASEPASPEDVQQAYQRLIKVDCFAFGGVGEGAETSQGELSFRIVASSTNALPMFRAALTNGTPEAQVYALCGIWHFAPNEFNAALEPILCPNPKVEEMAGCFIRHEHLIDAVARIRKGNYDRYLSPKKEK